MEIPSLLTNNVCTNLFVKLMYVHLTLIYTTVSKFAMSLFKQIYVLIDTKDVYFYLNKHLIRLQNSIISQKDVIKIPIWPEIKEFVYFFLFDAYFSIFIRFINSSCLIYITYIDYLSIILSKLYHMKWNKNNTFLN